MFTQSLPIFPGDLPWHLGQTHELCQVYQCEDSVMSKSGKLILPGDTRRCECFGDARLIQIGWLLVFFFGVGGVGSESDILKKIYCSSTLSICSLYLSKETSIFKNMLTNSHTLLKWKKKQDHSIGLKQLNTLLTSQHDKVTCKLIFMCISITCYLYQKFSN